MPLDGNCGEVIAAVKKSWNAIEPEMGGTFCVIHVDSGGSPCAIFIPHNLQGYGRMSKLQAV